MSREGIVREDRFRSRALRETAGDLNFIWRLARAYRAPELIEFWEVLGRSLSGSPPVLPFRRNGRPNAGA